LAEKETVDKQDKVIELLEEILRWTRIRGIPNVKTVLDALPDREKVAYQFSDGRSSDKIGEVCGVSGMTVTNYWRRWFTLGIAEPSKNYKGRFERTFSLEDLGIEVPSIEVSAKAKTKKEAEPEEAITKEGDNK